tara:strand:- start:1597 stop:1857 length:261 start_codon:yes stop_codon:yes gene_type:complete
MTIYRCECGKEEKEIGKATIVLRDGKWVCKEAECSCGKYMDSKPEDGMPQLKRTEASLSKKKRHDKLWDGAKEKLIGERGVNEPFK